MKRICLVFLGTMLLFLNVPAAYGDLIDPLSSSIQYSIQIADNSIGGWLLNDTQMISSYRSDGFYTLKLEKITGRDANGVPIPLVLDEMSFPLNKTDYISRGSGYCGLKTGKKDSNLVVLINRKGIYKAWTVYKSKFKALPIKTIKCTLSDEDGVAN